MGSSILSKPVISQWYFVMNWGLCYTSEHVTGTRRVYVIRCLTQEWSGHVTGQVCYLVDDSGKWSLCLQMWPKCWLVSTFGKWQATINELIPRHAHNVSVSIQLLWIIKCIFPITVKCLHCSRCSTEHLQHPLVWWSISCWRHCSVLHRHRSIRQQPHLWAHHHSAR